MSFILWFLGHVLCDPQFEQSGLQFTILLRILKAFGSIFFRSAVIFRRRRALRRKVTPQHCLVDLKGRLDSLTRMGEKCVHFSHLTLFPKVGCHKAKYLLSRLPKTLVISRWNILAVIVVQTFQKFSCVKRIDIVDYCLLGSCLPTL